MMRSTTFTFLLACAFGSAEMLYLLGWLVVDGFARKRVNTSPAPK